MTAVPFFVPIDGGYQPQDPARGPWDRESLHGRVVAGILAHEMEVRYGDSAFQVSRLSVDMFRVAPYAPVSVKTELVRDGNRIRVSDATLFSGETAIGRANMVMLRRAEPPEGSVWKPEPWDAPHPDTIEVRPPRNEGWEPAWETRSLNFQFRQESSPGVKKRAWLREVRPLIAGIELTPTIRCALAADFTSPIANGGSAGLHYVNADLTLYLHRDLAGEWIGMDVVDHQSADGVATGTCMLHDLSGALGSSTVCAVANRRKGNW